MFAEYLSHIKVGPGPFKICLVSESSIKNTKHLTLKHFIIIIIDWPVDLVVRDLFIRRDQRRRNSGTTHLFKEVGLKGKKKANCLPETREPFKRDTVDLAPGATEGVCRVFSESKSDTVFRSTVVGSRHSMIFPVGQKKKNIWIVSKSLKIYKSSLIKQKSKKAYWSELRPN